MRVRGSVKYFLFSYIILLFFSSCTSYKKLTYLKDAEKLTEKQLELNASVYEAKIMPNDVLNITVNSETPGAASDFNITIPVHTGALGASNIINLAEGNMCNYVVDSKGNIKFPVLGNLKLAGLTRSEAESLIFSMIYPDYLTEKPIVNVRFTNYSISVLGEVTRPGIYRSENAQMTIFDALAAAGDVTIYGRRDNVLLIRSKDNGALDIKRINLQDKNLLLDKDIFYLQQNDKIYVETNRTKGNSRSFGAMESVGLSVLSILISIASIIIYNRK